MMTKIFHLLLHKDKKEERKFYFILFYVLCFYFVLCLKKWMLFLFLFLEKSFEFIITLNLLFLIFVLQSLFSPNLKIKKILNHSLAMTSDWNLIRITVLGVFCPSIGTVCALTFAGNSAASKNPSTIPATKAPALKLE